MITINQNVLKPNMTSSSCLMCISIFLKSEFVFYLIEIAIATSSHLATDQLYEWPNQLRQLDLNVVEQIQAA